MASETELPDTVAPADIESIRDLLIRWGDRAVSAARKFSKVIIFGVALNLLVAAVVVFYFMVGRGNLGWLPISLLILLALPTLLFGLYSWIFAKVLAMPGELSKVSDTLCEVLRTVTSLGGGVEPAATRGWKQRGKALFGYGKIAYSIYSVVRQRSDAAAFAGLKFAAMMGTPPFWLILGIAAAASLVLAVLIPLFCLVHYLLS